ncbi:MAG: hypothetical protein LBF62_08290 [Tannerellaceae bacterium]|nr:hypothetical protein [Tannerellaceae bacterium]
MRIIFDEEVETYLNELVDILLFAFPGLTMAIEFTPCKRTDEPLNNRSPWVVSETSVTRTYGFTRMVTEP